MDHTKMSLPLDPTSSYTFYILDGSGWADNQKIEKDDAVRISDTNSLDIHFKGELFYIQTLTELDYKPIWA